MTADPALAFWLRYTESEGALHERGDGATTVLLPELLQVDLGLPEQLSVTTDPEVAREDGALLLAPGHPSLDTAADRVLERGDVGRVLLGWPAGQVPSGQSLVSRLREHVHIAHGRIDAGEEPPHAGYLPVLSVGALVTYTVTLDDRYQERAEAWVDATTALPLTESTAAALRAAPRAEALAHRPLAADLHSAAAKAEAVLAARAGERLEVLRGQGRSDKEAEVVRVDDYYRAALATLAKRLATASPERRAALQARAAATESERARRLAEVEEKYRGSLTIRWFRAHEVLVPVLSLDAVVRRGRREYPLTLRWLLPLRTVAPLACPHCGAPSPLVAGKERLGCESCLVPSRPPAPVAARPPRSAAPGAVRPDEASPNEAPPDVASPTKAPPAERAAANRVPAQSRPADRDKVAGDGSRLALRFWQEVADDDRRISRLVVPGSPADTMVQLWGARGPAVALGMVASEDPHEVEVWRGYDGGGADHASPGRVTSLLKGYNFTLRWQGAGRPGTTLVSEVISGMAAPGIRLAPYLMASWWRSPWLVASIPVPRTELDPVRRALLAGELAVRGFPLLMRALTAWNRVRQAYGQGAGDAGAAEIAAAIARLVAAASGTQVPYAEVAAAYGADTARVRAVAAELRPLLRLGPSTGW